MSELKAHAESATIATDDERRTVLGNPQVQRGLADYFERFERYDGDIPTISIDKALRQLSEG